jgi:hypothetical protein
MRLEKRNKKDFRLTNDSLYTEIHHIIPRSLGGCDDLTNLVELLPEEHIFIHMLRYKIYKKREDALAVRFCLNGLKSYNFLIKTKPSCVELNKKLRMGYAWIRSHAQTIRQNEGWHTPDGIERISKARKGKIVVKDAVTGEFIGMVSNTHPNVLSKKWVHHTKGRVLSEEERKKRKDMGKGQKNNNASGLLDEYFIQKGIELFEEFGVILPWPVVLKISQQRNFKWIKSLKCRFDNKGLSGYYTIMEEKTNTKYNPYVFSDRQTKAKFYEKL